MYAFLILVVAEVEEQDTLTEALRDRVKEKLKTVKVIVLIGL